MKALDTSAWIEWLIASEAGEAVLAEIPGLTPLLVPTMVQFELAKWLIRFPADRFVDLGSRIQ